MDRSKIIDTLKQRGGFITTGEVKSRGEYEQLRRAIEDGTLMRIRNGVYVEMSALANNMIDVERIVPHGVLCLYSAFAHYGLSTQVPSATCIAIEAKRKVRLPEYPPIDLYYWKKENLEFGIVKKTEHSHPLGMVVSTHFRCGKGVKRGLKNGALPFNID